MTMKIWYQSMSRQSTWSNYSASLKRLVNKFKEADTEIEVHGITKIGGYADQYRYLEYLESGEVMENVHTATKRGFDAFLIGNVADPGLRECREITNMPVLGLCETSLHLACLMGANFSLVTINEKFTPRIVENVYRARLTERLACVRRMSADRISDLDRAFSDETLRQNAIQEFLAAANETVEQGAEVVIPAGGVLIALLAEAGVHQAARGAPILNGVCALIKAGEMAVKLNRLMGGSFVSKRLAYAPPPPEQIEDVRRFYGNIYPTVNSPSNTASESP
jgi:allantoin racemase